MAMQPISWAPFPPVTIRDFDRAANDLNLSHLTKDDIDYAWELFERGHKYRQVITMMQQWNKQYDSEQWL